MNFTTILKKIISPVVFNRNSQFAHFFAGATVYLTIEHFSYRWMWYLVPVGLALAAWKEFWYDKHYESAEERGSDLEDFFYYFLGIAYAVIVVML